MGGGGGRPRAHRALLTPRPPPFPGWALPIVAGIIYSLFYASTREIGDGPAKRGKGDDSGLSL